MVRATTASWRSPTLVSKPSPALSRSTRPILISSSGPPTQSDLAAAYAACLPWQGRPVTIDVAARRFHCLNRDCGRRTFVERLTEVACRSGRRTGRLREPHHHLGLALGGEAGARLAARIAVPTSPTRCCACHQRG